MNTNECLKERIVPKELKVDKEILESILNDSISALNPLKLDEEVEEAIESLVSLIIKYDYLISEEIKDVAFEQDFRKIAKQFMPSQLQEIQGFVKESVFYYKYIDRLFSNIINEFNI